MEGPVVGVPSRTPAAAGQNRDMARHGASSCKPCGKACAKATLPCAAPASMGWPPRRDTNAAPALRDIFPRETNPASRATILRALGTLKDSGTLELVKGELKQRP